MRNILVAAWLVVAGLALGQPAMATTATDARCQASANELSLPSNGGYSAGQITILTGCKQDAQGVWFWPSSLYDKRLTITTLNNDELARTSDLRERLFAQYQQLLRLLQNTPDMFAPAASAKTNYLISVDDLTSGGISLGLGLNPNYNEGPGTQAASEDYGQRLGAFLSDPANIDLARFASWWVQRRIAAIPPSLLDRMNPMVRQPYLLRMGVYRAPWPSELSNSIYLNEYLRWALDHGSTA